MKKTEACLVCGDELIYFEESREMECEFCRKKYMSNASCKNGHFICDECHAAKALDIIQKISRETASKNPLEIAVSMMKEPYIHMHGPENHVLVGSALLAAYKNCGGKINFETSLKELVKRAKQLPGGICGFWGSCGAAVSTGIFVSVITGSTPMAEEAFGLCNKMTSAALAAIGNAGGPRCCKRNAFLAIEQAVKFCKENLEIEMEFPEKYICGFSSRNTQCIGKRCPFNAKHL